jgi:hypothetical protein
MGIVQGHIGTIAKWRRRSGGDKGRCRETKPVCRNDRGRLLVSHVIAVKPSCHPILGGTSDRTDVWKECLWKANGGAKCYEMAPRASKTRHRGVHGDRTGKRDGLTK